jgi:hypothetical protein
MNMVICFTEPATLSTPRTAPCKTLMFDTAQASAAGFAADLVDAEGDEPAEERAGQRA